ncbi:MarR family winged helix-turn-helix transcriptional regulator [Saccharibacillus sp. CPCC 101409]|uniref:MarR family winged helix-turn-helix transcriptional regulator n=1 Tax=Saccharibacillus sp. CPCC 101409 TaxID=3058041 RepID=UPI0026717FF6|nr:MarR family winged helix-turn-helix transcriptional regulator [Saccharibacillus sp. CPCC 101409]MDO3411086.1 MarR family winged helix-turn-helix transcriptional regulator [Saccharibacillus sp. CPCC 101409]
MKEVLREIEAVARCSEAISSIEFKHLKLSRGLHLYLTFVCENPGTAAGEVPDRLKVKRAAAARALQKLEDDGLIRSREASDLRKDKRVYPTEPGKSAYLFIREEGQYSDRSSLRGLSPEETERLLDMLYRIRLNVEKDWRFVQKGGRRPYIHDYYDRLVAAADEDSAAGGASSDAPPAGRSEGERETAPPAGPVPDSGENAPRGNGGLWTFEETAEEARRAADPEDPS